MKKLLIAVIVLGLAGYGIWKVSQIRGGDVGFPEFAQPAPKSVGVIYKNGVFTPSAVRIKVGDSVRFVNQGTSPIRVSSNPHPIHTSYPALESGSLAAGATYVFTAIEKVTIGYHNHFDAGTTGKIIVE